MMLKDRVAIVTGASSGMGWAISLLFAKKGAKIVAVARRKERLDKLVVLAEEQGGTVIAVQGDVSKLEDIDNMIDVALNDFGRLDILVNNAGILDNFMPTADITDELWDKIMTVNLTGPFRACRKAIPIMIEQGGGVIINIASIGGLYGGRAGSAYTVSKHGLVGLTKSIGYLYGDKGIRCNAICPGGVDTEIAKGDVNFHPLGIKKAMAGIGLNIRTGSPEEIAKTALFLASDDSSLINGTTLVADSGWTAY